MDYLLAWAFFFIFLLLFIHRNFTKLLVPLNLNFIVKRNMNEGKTLLGNATKEALKKGATILPQILPGSPVVPSNNNQAETQNSPVPTNVNPNNTHNSNIPKSITSSDTSPNKSPDITPSSSPTKSLYQLFTETPHIPPINIPIPHFIGNAEVHGVIDNKLTPSVRQLTREQYEKNLQPSFRARPRSNSIDSKLDHLETNMQVRELSRVPSSNMQVRQFSSIPSPHDKNTPLKVKNKPTIQEISAKKAAKIDNKTEYLNNQLVNLNRTPDEKNNIRDFFLKLNFDWFKAESGTKTIVLKHAKKILSLNDVGINYFGLSNEEQQEAINDFEYIIKHPTDFIANNILRTKLSKVPLNAETIYFLRLYIYALVTKNEIQCRFLINKLASFQHISEQHQIIDAISEDPRLQDFSKQIFNNKKEIIANFAFYREDWSNSMDLLESKKILPEEILQKLRDVLLLNSTSIPFSNSITDCLNKLTELAICLKLLSNNIYYYLYKKDNLDKKSREELGIITASHEIIDGRQITSGEQKHPDGFISYTNWQGNRVNIDCDIKICREFVQEKLGNYKQRDGIVVLCSIKRQNDNYLAQLRAKNLSLYINQYKQDNLEFLLLNKNISNKINSFHAELLEFSLNENNTTNDLTKIKYDHLETYNYLFKGYLRTLEVIIGIDEYKDDGILCTMPEHITNSLPEIPNTTEFSVLFKVLWQSLVFIIRAS